MNERTETHYLQTDQGTSLCTITEYPDRIVFEQRFSNYVHLFDDSPALENWFCSLLRRYTDDPRPKLFINPDTGVGMLAEDG